LTGLRHHDLDHLKKLLVDLGEISVSGKAKRRA